MSAALLSVTKIVMLVFATYIVIMFVSPVWKCCRAARDHDYPGMITITECPTTWLHKQLTIRAH